MVREFLALPLNTAKASVRHFGWSLPQQQVPVPGRDGSIRCSLLLAVRQLNSQRHCRKGAVWIQGNIFIVGCMAMCISQNRRIEGDVYRKVLGMYVTAICALTFSARCLMLAKQNNMEHRCQQDEI